MFSHQILKCNKNCRKYAVGVNSCQTQVLVSNCPSRIMVLHHLVSFTLFFCYVEPPSIPKHGVWSETFGHRHTVHSTMQHNTSSIQIKTGVTQEAASGRDSVRCLSKARGHPDGGFGRRRETGRGQRGRAWERMGVVQRCRTPSG